MLLTTGQVAGSQSQNSPTYVRSCGVMPHSHSPQLQALPFVPEQSFCPAEKHANLQLRNVLASENFN